MTSSQDNEVITHRPCRHVRCDLRPRENRLLTLPYISLRQAELVPAEKKDADERLSLTFDLGTMYIRGTRLTRVLDLVQVEELFSIQKGSIEGERAPTISDIVFIPANLLNESQEKEAGESNV
jgi:hypothetical protein